MRRRHRTLHWRAWLLLAVLLPAILIGALLARQDRAVPAPPVRLAEPGLPR